MDNVIKFPDKGDGSEPPLVLTVSFDGAQSAEIIIELLIKTRASVDAMASVFARLLAAEADEDALLNHYLKERRKRLQDYAADLTERYPPNP